MSQNENKSKPQNSLIVGIIIGAGLGMVFGRSLFADSGNGFVYGSILGAGVGLVFGIIFRRTANKEIERNGRTAKRLAP